MKFWPDFIRRALFRPPAFIEFRRDAKIVIGEYSTSIEKICGIIGVHRRGSRGRDGDPRQLWDDRGRIVTGRIGIID
jgi:hypothetical protein